ncbi:zinc finger protein VAR3, chloroplastic isoform X2 [Sesamum indicum]|uniref:Zinc finger protein VAR3, chloroplastic isoform X2 n=1 Tax=Sesamum indicum TaxID=4182 RepID=A0A6I9T5F9_SESIN|nr:zinc finger protein VAR3, chloroplastic isoform X2 [Sesamum indicum]
MGGGVTRFMTLLITPFPPLRPSLILLNRRVSSLSAAPVRLLTLSSPPNTKPPTPQLLNSFHSQSSNNTYTLSSSAAQHHPWPEWTHFLSVLPSGQGASAPEEYRILPEDAFVVYEELPDDFVRAAATCLAFARARPNLLGLLSKRDIEAVVSNGTPFLFKSALDTARRMRAFLAPDESNVAEFDKANTVDLMKYIISYASNPTVSFERNGLYSRELVDSSVRYLLHELVAVSSGAQTGYMPASDNQFSDRDGQTRKPFGQNIEMKRGDWICRKCSFMNFARNMKCLECEEPRPKRQLTGREWECPQCNFFNYGRNLACLRCDCRRPGAPLFKINNPQSVSGYNGDYASKSNTENRLAENEEKAQRWFSKISQLNNATDINTAASDEDFPEIMPLRKGDNRFVDSMRKTPLDRRIVKSQHQNSSSSSGNPEGITPEQNITEFSSSPSQSGSSDFQYSRSSSPNHVPLVPLPADTFSSRDQTSEMDDGKKVPIEFHETGSSAVRNQTTMISESQSSGQNFQAPKSSAHPIDIQNKEKEQAEKSERWFKRIAELHNVKDLPSAVSDEDFPEIMPMRKGENRFVVGKKKDRSLTSPKYKRQVAMEQANNTTFVPFVPFPPGYFARKDTQQPTGQDSPVKSVGKTSTSNITAETDKLDDLKNGTADTSTVQRNDYKPMSRANATLPSEIVAEVRNPPRAHNQSVSSTSQFSGDNATPAAGSSSQSSITSPTISSNTGNDGPCGTTPTRGVSSQPPKNENVQSSWTTKSLEGSAVKEDPDPLDMSEEAKAERWFKRVAQIKDISELSQIPDEDFPSIMPMRKGVNRFVVSKRKTPLERRLTSQQYRRNLPIVSSDSVKKESDNS